MKKQSGFEKFMSKEKSGAAKKEVFRQEKKKITKERKEFFEKKRQESRQTTRDEVQDKKDGRADTGNPRSIKAKPLANAQMPLNKYIAHSGICSRRDAVELVKNGKVKVNGEVLKEPGYKVADSDEITVNGKKLHIVKDLVYILLNKPKDY